jgi:hypothetical protein
MGSLSTNFIKSKKLSTTILIKIGGIEHKAHEKEKGCS